MAQAQTGNGLGYCFVDMGMMTGKEGYGIYLPMRIGSGYRPVSGGNGHVMYMGWMVSENLRRRCLKAAGRVACKEEG